MEIFGLLKLENYCDFFNTVAESNFICSGFSFCIELKITPIITIIPPIIWLKETVSLKIKTENTNPKTGTRFNRDTETLAESFFSPKLYRRKAATEQPTLKKMRASAEVTLGIFH